ncbi:low-density lipoprotein receptor-related protein 12-like isoform X1 [Varroa destructor]|uniref:CUB domain-containing protein n=1 Tax=Varroa destructor TaxID=109461 RepID=A0A7M7MEC4_VARDE|nr:low-density lipoprotein receptor-related protein 12-like isoform X1 [Varroa destructor]
MDTGEYPYPYYGTAASGIMLLYPIFIVLGAGIKLCTSHSTLIASYWCGAEQFVPSCIETPFFPAAYPAYVTCEWFIRSPKERQAILIEGFSYEMQEADVLTGECNRDSLTFYTAKSNLTLCGSNVLRSFDSESSWIRAVFRARHSVNQGGFRIHFALKSDNAILDN